MTNDSNLRYNVEVENGNIYANVEVDSDKIEQKQ